MSGIISRPRPRLDRIEVYNQATADVDPPLAVIDLDSFDANADDLVRRASGLPIRVASKSLRCRFMIERALARPGFRGVMGYSLAEALWLHGTLPDTDLLVAYPTADRSALRALATSELARRLITLTIDSPDHLDFIDAALGPGHPDLRVCLEIDVAWWPLERGALRVGTWRSPLRTPRQAADFAAAVLARPGFTLAGVMGYEGQIAGVGDAPPGRPLRGAAIRAMQSRSARELATRRAAIVDAVRELAPLEFVNGGGTGSIERTTAEDAVTEIAAGSGLYQPWLFDSYRSFRGRPAALFALPVVRRPGPETATALGGGYPASGAAGKDRLPQPYLPQGLSYDPNEAAGEVQTPLLGKVAASLRVGDRVWFRHTKAGELCERFDTLHLISGDEVVRSVPTYRGEGKTFL